MTTTELRKLQRAYDAGLARTEQLRKARDAGIVAALDERMRQADIMRSTGLSRARVTQIKRGTR